MSADNLAVFGTGVAVLAVLVPLILHLHRDLSGRIHALSARIGGVEQRVARIEGLLEGALTRVAPPQEEAG